MYSRRDFGKMTLAAWPLTSALAKINSTVDGVRVHWQQALDRHPWSVSLLERQSSVCLPRPKRLIP